jgi:hypothetical protein
MSSTAYDRLLTALDERGSRVTRRGDSAVAQCPAHEDQHASLSLRPGTGLALVFCHVGCATVDVLAALGLTTRDLYDNGVGVDYGYDDGRVVHRKWDKSFPQSGNVKGRPQLYHLSSLRAAVAAGATVYVVEGEKDVLAVESIGGVATCNPMGAGKWGKIDPSPLYGAHVVVVVDDDEPGRRHARDVVTSLDGHCPSIRTVVAAEGKDAADHITAGHGLDGFADVVLFPPTDLGALLDDVETFLGRFVAYPSEHERVAHTLWIAHTWLMKRWDSTPRIAFLSPEPGSGKSRALEVTEPLVPRPVHAVNATPAYLFRKVSDDAGLPTILYDEIDTLFGPRAKENEEVRGMLNAGHRRGAVAGRAVARGKVFVTEELPAYCAVALAGLNDLPDTLMTRSIVVRMRRRSPSEHVEPWRLRQHEEARPLRERLDAWSAQVDDIAWPDMPSGVEDRDADMWEAPLVVADLAGGHWPERARVSAVTLVTASKGESRSLGVMLLGDLRDVFVKAEADAMHTERLLDALTKIDESPWGDLRGKPLDARGLANRLRRYGVKPTTVRVDDVVKKGYRAEDLYDPWLRYLPDGEGASWIKVDDEKTHQEGHFHVSPDGAVTSVTSDTDAAASLLCDVCGEPMHPAAAAGGFTTHPTCDPEATS